MPQHVSDTPNPYPVDLLVNLTIGCNPDKWGVLDKYAKGFLMYICRGFRIWVVSQKVKYEHGNETKHI